MTPQATTRAEAAPRPAAAPQESPALELTEPLALELAQRGACWDPDGRLMIKNLRRAELEEWCVSRGAPRLLLPRSTISYHKGSRV